MKVKEILEILNRDAKEFTKTAQKRLLVNSHLTKLKDDDIIDQRIIDAVIVGFLNHVAANQGIDLAMCAEDLKE